MSGPRSGSACPPSWCAPPWSRVCRPATAGAGRVPTAPAAEASTPLDGVLCDVLPTDLLADALGFEAYTYAYFHHPISGGGYDHPGYYYVCMLQSDYTT